ncbi:MAG: Rhomboid family protein [Bacillales bacterium]|jgi:membrane associated rhomboid family serine protease|nr:Rhomboid family protein [Bacillales bacterium]
MKLKEYSSKPGTLIIILINILIYITLNFFPHLTDVFLLDPNLVMDKPWTLLTAFFSHEVTIHALLNILLIFVFGAQLEKVTNAKEVVFSYFLCGLIGSLATLAYAPLIGWDGDPVAGASAAAFGIVAVYSVLEPNAIILKSKSKNWLIALFVVNLLLTIQNPQTSIGGAAHAAGIIVGLIYGYMYKKRRN